MFQIDTSAITILAPIFALLIGFINLQRDVDRGDLSTTNTRIIFLAIGLGVVLLLLSIKPLYWSLTLSTIFVVPPTLMFFWVNRRGKQRQEWQDEEAQIAHLHILESSQTQSLLLHLIRKADGKPTNFPSINDAVSVLFGQIEEILLKANAGMEVKMSLLRPREDGKFDVIASNRHVSLTAKDTMVEKLQWASQPTGVGGHAIEQGHTIRFAHIDSDDAEKIWIKITNPRENSIMCIPIKNKLVTSGVPRHKEFLAVLCISCSEKHSLTEQHETFFKKVFIPSFAYILLFYVLYNKFDRN
ncbi:MAG: hypothetical protein Q9P01_06750 [Anaerolineae bacterium]|nr:hypothetical protein [Anaerolineae bacterium]MDQ7034529.1 hypothetical protein [Anaerolineae bacterium]